MLGEAIAADTWIDREAFLARLGAERPWWAPGPLDEIPRWLERIGAAAGPGGIEQLRADSLRYGMLMRKFQIEAYRREIPYGGYNVSVLRDIPNASMGLLDYLGRPKWSEADWAWHGDTMCLLKTDSRPAQFHGGRPAARRDSPEPLRPAAHRERANWKSRCGTWRIQANVLQRYERNDIEQNIGTLARLAELDWPLPPATEPKHLALARDASNRAKASFATTGRSGSCRRRAGLGRQGAIALVAFERNGERTLSRRTALRRKQSARASVVAARFDDDLVRMLENGGRVLLLPDGRKEQFSACRALVPARRAVHPGHALSARVPRDLFVELQHFDLAGPVVPDVGYLDAIDPILMLWDTHDLKTVKTHGLVFETRAAKGRLLVSAAASRGPGEFGRPLAASGVARPFELAGSAQERHDGRPVGRSEETIFTPSASICPSVLGCSSPIRRTRGSTEAGINLNSRMKTAGRKSASAPIGNRKAIPIWTVGRGIACRSRFRSVGRTRIYCCLLKAWTTCTSYT